jgi:hypothetical protein
MAAQHVIRYVCDYCGEATVEEMSGPKLRPWSQLGWSDAPSGWTWIGEKLACPRHEVLVTNVKESE